MSRHAAPVPADERARLGNLSSAVIAAVVTVTLVVPPLFGRPGLAAAVAALQVGLVYAWVVGTAVPGRIGATLIGLGAAAASDILVYREPDDGLAPILNVYAAVFFVAIVHQLCRGVVRVRVTESLAGVVTLSAAVTALPAFLALDQITDGDTLLATAAAAIGLSMIAGHLVDAVAPAPHFDTEVARGLLGVLVSGGVGAGVGYLRLNQSDVVVNQYGGLILGGGLGLVVALAGVGLAYVAESVRPRRAPFDTMVLPYLRVAVPVALAAPVAYFLGLAVTS